MIHPFRLACFAFFIATAAVMAAPSEPPAPNASELAARLSAARQDGACLVRARLEIKEPGGAVRSALQLQIKSRSSKAGADLSYQVLWPKERKGEAVLMRRVGRQPATGAVLGTSGTLRPLTAAQMKEPLLGSSLTCNDVIENWYAWENQAITGAEVIDRVPCQILESKPGHEDHSAYGRVRSWIDVRRLVPMRIEKYGPSGQLACRIDTTRVASDDLGHPIPANLTVHREGDAAVTEIDGSKIKHGAALSDRDFTLEGLRDLTPPRTAE